MSYLSKVRQLNENRDSLRNLDATIPVETRIGDHNSALDEMIDHANGGMSTFTWYAGKQTDVTQNTANDVTVTQKREKFMDAGRRERKLIAQASLTLTHSNLTRTSRTGMSGAKLTKARL